MEKKIEGALTPLHGEASSSHADSNKKQIHEMLSRTPSNKTLVKTPGKNKRSPEENEMQKVFDVSPLELALPEVKRLRPNVRSDENKFIEKVLKKNEVQWIGQLDYEEIVSGINKINIRTGDNTVVSMELHTSSKSTISKMSIGKETTDKSVAQVRDRPIGGNVFPRHWHFDDKLGSFVCTVTHVKENNYKFKVLVVPGPYADDPVTLSMLVRMFNPLSYAAGESREEALRKAKMMLALPSTPNEFFGPQTVNAFIALWLSNHRDLQVTITKSDMIMSVNISKKTITTTSDMQVSSMSTNALEQPGTSSSTKIVSTTKSSNLTVTTKCAQFLTAIFGYNKAMYPDIKHMGIPVNILREQIRALNLTNEELLVILRHFFPWRASN